MQDATVQSIPQTSQSPVAVAPSSYVVPAQAPAPQAPMGMPVQYQVGTSYPQAVPQAAPSYQSAPTQYAPQSQPGNPWESAFNKVVGLLSSPVQSPFQGQSYQTTQYAPANYGQQYSNPATQQSGLQTWSPNQGYSPSSSLTSSAVSSPAVANELRSEVQTAIADYLHLSPESRNVIDAYGWDAPAILNNYGLQLEAMLDSAVAWGGKAQEVLHRFADFSVNEHQENLVSRELLHRYADFSVAEHQENLAYNEILTNPDVLSDYTLKFFGPEGPYPVYEDESQLETRGYPTTSAYQTLGQFPAPPAASAPQQPENFWGSFKQQMDMNPESAWRLLNQAQPQVVANKLFVME